jgi:hypothetical protein
MYLELARQNPGMHTRQRKREKEKQDDASMIPRSRPPDIFLSREAGGEERRAGGEEAAEKRANYSSSIVPPTGRGGGASGVTVARERSSTCSQSITILLLCVNITTDVHAAVLSVNFHLVTILS